MMRILMFTTTAVFMLVSNPVVAAVVSPPSDDGDAGVLLQAAVDQCEAGGMVQLQPGVYRIAQPLRLHGNMKFCGTGDTTILFAGETPGVMLDLSGCEKVEVSNITLDGANNPNATQGVFAHNARRLNLHHLIIRNLVKGSGFGPHGILFAGKNPTKEDGVTDSVIDSCRIENIAVDAPFGCGIRMSWGSSHNRITGNTITDTGRGGIFGDNGSTHLVIQENVITGSNGEGLGIEVWGGCDYSVIEDNAVDHWLSIGGSSYCAARRNVVSSNSGDYKFCAIEAIGSYLVITESVVDGGAKIGLSVSNVDANHFVFWGNNRVAHCNQWGAQIQGEAGGAAYQYFYRCSFTDMPLETGPVWYPGDEGHGLRFNGNVYGITMEECAFTNNGRLGVQFTGEGVNRLRFDRCVFTGNKGTAAGSISADTLLDWRECAVEGNGSNVLPTAQPWEGNEPTASFNVPETIQAGKPVIFKSTSTAGSDEIMAVLWDFGDGAPSGGTEVEHTYSNPGDYKTTLVAWDKNGRAGRCEKIITAKEE